jgi:hypothetical protein
MSEGGWLDKAIEYAYSKWNHYIRRSCTCHKFPWQEWQS